MARKKAVEVDEEPKLEPGTVEYEAQQFFEREKAAYEERTGETVTYVPSTPVTRTPLAVEEVSAVEEVEEEAAVDETAEGEG